MQLVIDANIAFSLLKKDSFSRKLMREHKLELYSHPFILDELRKHASELCAKVGVSDDKFDRLLLILSKLIIVDKASENNLASRHLFQLFMIFVESWLAYNNQPCIAPVLPDNLECVN